MRALVYNADQGLVSLQERPQPVPAAGEALIRVARAGICSTDIEITRGYVPGYNQILGHEFVGTIVTCASAPEWEGKRVVGEINCNCAKFTCANAIFLRNHAPDRTVLGIINKDGCLAEYLTLPVENLHEVPQQLSNAEACFTEPLAAACRIIEQSLLEGRERIAVIGDGKLGLLVAQVLACHAPGRVTLFGRHTAKMALVQGLAEQLVVDEHTANEYAAAFDLVVEAAGVSSSISNALALTKPLGIVLLKSTVSTKDPNAPKWSEIANDVVVNEKQLVGSRCGPFGMALSLLVQRAELRSLVKGMLSQVVPIHKGVEAMELAKKKGVLKVQVTCALP